MDLSRQKHSFLGLCPFLKVLVFFWVSKVWFPLWDASLLTWNIHSRKTEPSKRVHNSASVMRVRFQPLVTYSSSNFFGSAQTVQLDMGAMILCQVAVCVNAFIPLNLWFQNHLIFLLHPSIVQIQFVWSKFNNCLLTASRSGEEFRSLEIVYISLLMIHMIPKWCLAKIYAVFSFPLTHFCCTS